MNDFMWYLSFLTFESFFKIDKQVWLCMSVLNMELIVIFSSLKVYMFYRYCCWYYKYLFHVCMCVYVWNSHEMFKPVNLFHLFNFVWAFVHWALALLAFVYTQNISAVVGGGGGGGNLKKELL